MDFKLVTILRKKLYEDVFKPATPEETVKRAEASPAAQDLVITDIRVDAEKRTRRNLAVYVDISRPFDRGDIVADFAWRRSDHMTADKEKVLAALEPFLEKKGLTRADILSCRYDRFCGCSMCPCSPGFTVKLKREIDHSYDIWLEPKKA
jgi:hypothetical protein